MKSIEESYSAIVEFKDGENEQLRNTLELSVSDNFVMEQNIISERVAKERFKAELKGYKEIASYMKSEVITSINDLVIKYDKPEKDPFIGLTLNEGEYIHKGEVDKFFIRVPKLITYEDDWVTLSGVVNKESIFIDSLSIFNKFDAVIGFKKSDKKFSWLRKRDPVVDLKSYNPYTKIVYVNNVVVDDKKGKVGNILLSKPAMFVYGLITGIAIK